MVWHDFPATDTPILAVHCERWDAAADAALAPRAVSNFKLSNTAKLRGSLAKAIRGTGYSTHVVVGDSLSSAYNGSGAFDFPNSWWRKMWRAMVTGGVPTAGTGRVAVTDYDPSGDVGSPVDPHDPRIVVAGGWTGTSAHLDSSASGDTITFTSDVAGEIVDVFYLPATSMCSSLKRSTVHVQMASSSVTATATTRTTAPATSATATSRRTSTTQ